MGRMSVNVFLRVFLTFKLVLQMLLSKTFLKNKGVNVNLKDHSNKFFMLKRILGQLPDVFYFCYVYFSEHY